MVLLDYLSVSRFQGADAGNFLQSQLSADVAALAPGEAGFACCCSPKGQVIGLLLLCRQDDGFLVAGSAALLPRILARLQMYVFRAKVEFFPQPDLFVHGTVAADAACGPGEFRPPGLGLGYHFSSQRDAGHQPSEAFKAVEIGHRVVWLDDATSESFIPQMLGFEQIGAVSFSKGCYPGQEIVARTRYLGKVKRKPLIVRTAEPCPAAPADRVELCRGENPVQGVVIDSAAEAGGTLLFVVAPSEPDESPTGLKLGNVLYRCATI